MPYDVSILQTFLKDFCEGKCFLSLRHRALNLVQQTLLGHLPPVTALKSTAFP